MQEYRVTTRVTVERVYIVLASDPKDAIAKTTDASPDNEADLDEETIDVSPTSKST
tara:strand:- start:819 stop:986 length:168 start_codon:yes stop_codon:yes gene_type:complete